MSSRHSTPISHDQDISGGSFHGANPYDEHGPYDTDFTISSRPPPISYDDPYSDAYNAEILNSETGRITSSPSDDSAQNHELSGKQRSPNRKERRMGRGRGYQQGEVRGSRQFGGRGRGRGRGRRDRGRRDDGSIGGELSPTRYGMDDSGWTNQPPMVQPMVEQFGLHQTSQYLNEPTFAPPMSVPNDGWSAQQFHHYPMQPFDVDPQWYQHQYVQPHINPRFASAFGMNVVGLTQPQEYSPVDPSGYYEQRYVPAQPPPSDEWAVHVGGEERPGIVKQEEDQ
jgi:H/ACA ribonucleoprotein complex non-core subunit NAF1